MCVVSLVSGGLDCVFEPDVVFDPDCVRFFGLCWCGILFWGKSGWWPGVCVRAGVCVVTCVYVVVWIKLGLDCILGQKSLVVWSVCSGGSVCWGLSVWGCLNFVLVGLCTEAEVVSALACVFGHECVRKSGLFWCRNVFWGWSVLGR